MFIIEVVGKQRTLDSEMGLLPRNKEEQTADKCKIVAECLKTYYIEKKMHDINFKKAARDQRDIS